MRSYYEWIDVYYAENEGLARRELWDIAKRRMLGVMEYYQIASGRRRNRIDRATITISLRPEIHLSRIYEWVILAPKIDGWDALDIVPALRRMYSEEALDKVIVTWRNYTYLGRRTRDVNRRVVRRAAVDRARLGEVENT